MVESESGRGGVGDGRVGRGTAKPVNRQETLWRWRNDLCPCAEKESAVFPVLGVFRTFPKLRCLAS